MTDVIIPPFPKMGGHGGEPDECTKKLDRTFGEKWVKKGAPISSKAEIEAWWPKGLVIKIHVDDKTGEIKVTSNCDELSKIKSKK